MISFAASAGLIAKIAASGASVAMLGDHHEIIEVEHHNCTFRVLSSTTGDHKYWSTYPPDGDEALYASIARYARGRVALDLGGWIGPTALFLACFAERVVVVEPVRESWGKLLLNLELNPEFSSKVELSRSAVGARFDLQHFTTTGSSMDQPLRFFATDETKTWVVDEDIEHFFDQCMIWKSQEISLADAGPEVDKLVQQLEEWHYCVKIDGLLDGVIFVFNAGQSRGLEIINAIADSRIDGMRAYEVSNVEFVESVETIPIGELLRRFPILADVGFIKMDIEGAEVDILPGLREFFFWKRPTLLVAIHTFVGPMVAKRVIFELEAVFSRVEPLSSFDAINASDVINTLDVLCTWSSRG